MFLFKWWDKFNLAPILEKKTIPIIEKTSQPSKAQKYNQLNEELIKKFQSNHPLATETQLKLMVYEELNKLLTPITPELSADSSTSTARLSTSPYKNEDDCYGLDDYPFDDIVLHNMDTWYVSNVDGTQSKRQYVKHGKDIKKIWLKAMGKDNAT